MKPGLLVVYMLAALNLPASYVYARTFEDEATPVEQQDFKTIDQINEGASRDGEATPIEQQDLKSVDQINEGTSNEEATPIEQDDTKTIDR